MSLKKHQISLAEAAKMTKKYRETPVGLLGQLLNGTKSGSFSKESIEEILKQPGCVDIRFYFAVKGVVPKITYVAVGVDSNGNDITTGVILDDAEMCPPNCPSISPLNS